MLTLCLDQKLNDPVEDLSGILREREDMESHRAATSAMKEITKFKCTNCNLSWMGDAKTRIFCLKSEGWTETLTLILSFKLSRTL